MRVTFLSLALTGVLLFPATGFPGESKPEPLIVTYGYSGTVSPVLSLNWIGPELPEDEHEALRAEMFELPWITGVNVQGTSVRLALSGPPKPPKALQAVAGVLEKRLATGAGIQLRMAGVRSKAAPQRRK